MNERSHHPRWQPIGLVMLGVFLAGLVTIILPGNGASAQNGCFVIINQQPVPCTPTPGRNPKQPPPEQPTPLPTNTPTSTWTPSPTASATARPLGTPTATRTDVPSPTALQTAAVLPPGPRDWVGSLIGKIVDLFHVPPDRIPPYFPVPTRTPTPRPDLNLILTDIEVTQAIQCMGRLDCPQDSVPLYTGKATLVRAYVRISSGPSLITGIGGALCPGDTGDAGCSDPIRPTGKITVSHISDPASIVRGDLGATLNFILPADWVASPGALTFTIYANYNLENAPEWDYTDNYYADTINLQSSQSLDVTFYPVSVKGVKPPLDERWQIVDWLKRAYPTSAVHVWERGGPTLFELDFNLDSTSGPGCGDAWNGLLSWLAWLRGSNPRHYYGMVDRSSLGAGAYGGCGYRPGDEAAGLSNTGTRRGGEVAAQELGHNLGRQHAPGCSAGSPDGSYPELPSFIDEFGVDVGRMQLYRPSDSYDFMGYCGGEANTWVSVYSYEALAGMLPSGVFVPGGALLARPASASSPDAAFLIASGSLSPTAAKIEHGFYRLSLPATSHDNLPDGPYTVQLRDAFDHILSSRTFGPDELSNSEATNTGTFYLVLPWKDKADAVVFLYQGRVIGRRVASRNAPVIKFVSPSAAEDWGSGGTHSLAWQASDQDGDPLTYMLQYSHDGGQTWDTLTPYATQTQVSIDASAMAGSSDARFRVLATDGFNTTEATTTSPLRVSDKPPDVHLALPTDGATINQGDALILEASGTDLEDGPLAGSALTWSSDRDGSLGSGELLVVRTLSPGEHLLTLTGTDRAGQTASVSVHVTVLPAPTVAPAAPIATQGGQSSLGAWVLIAVVGAAAVMGGVWAWLRRRRHSGDVQS